MRGTSEAFVALKILMTTNGLLACLARSKAFGKEIFGDEDPESWAEACRFSGSAD